MRFTLDTDTLRRALERVRPALPSKRRRLEPVYPRLLLRASVEGVTFVLSDGLLRISHTAPSPAVAAQGECLVDFTSLMKLVRAFKGGEVVLSLADERLEVARQQKSKALECTGTAHYPPLAVAHAPGSTYTVERVEVSDFNARHGRPGYHYTDTYSVQEAWTQRLTIDTGALADLVGSVAYASARDNARPVFESICLQLKDDVLTAWAADAFRIASRSLRVAGAGTWQHEVLLRAEQIERALPALLESGEVTLEIEQGMHRCTQVRTASRVFPTHDPACLKTESVRLSQGNTCASILPLNGTYPDFSRVLGPAQAVVLPPVTCSTRGLRQAAEELFPLVRWGPRFVRLRADRRVLRVEAPQQEGQEAAVRSIALPVGPDSPVEAGFHCGALVALLNAVCSEELSIEFPVEGKRIAFFRDLANGSTHVRMIFDARLWRGKREGPTGRWH